MDSFSIYRVVIQSSHSEGRYQREYVGPATSEDDAVQQAWTVFKERPGDRLVTVEVVDREAWVEDEDAILPQGGDEGVSSQGRFGVPAAVR
jgi:hypothetical protein